MIERRQKPQRALDRKLPELATLHPGHSGWFDAVYLCSLGLLESAPLHDAVNFDHQLGLDQMLFRIQDARVLWRFVPPAFVVLTNEQ